MIHVRWFKDTDLLAIIPLLISQWPLLKIPSYFHLKLINTILPENDKVGCQQHISYFWRDYSAEILRRLVQFLHWESLQSTYHILYCVIQVFLLLTQNIPFHVVKPIIGLTFSLLWTFYLDIQTKSLML